MKLAQAVFGKDNQNSDGPMFNYPKLEEVFREVILKSKLLIHPERPLRDPESYKTFVVASEDGRPVRLRTYNSPENTFNGTIWEAARATSAVPRFFEPCIIQGRSYSAGYSNPSSEALREAREIWPGCEIGCLLSIGSGLEREFELTEIDESGERHNQSYRRVESSTVSIEVASYIDDLIHECETTHSEMSLQLLSFDRDDVYFRFNVPQLLSEIHVDETKRSNLVRQYTYYYFDARIPTRKTRKFVDTCGRTLEVGKDSSPA